MTIGLDARPHSSRPSLAKRRLDTTAAEGASPTWRWILVVTVLSRLLIWPAVLFGRVQVPGNLPDGAPPDVPRWLEPWVSYDGGLYLDIARNGYSRTTSAFFPLYPTLIGLTRSSVLATTLIGIVVSTMCFGVALQLLARLIELDYGPTTARHAVVVTAFFPFAAIWGSVYTESLFLLLLTGTWLLVRRGRWGLAIVPALLTGFTRNAGIALGVALAFEYVQQRRTMRPGEPRSAQPPRPRLGIAALTAAAPMLGFVVVMVNGRRQFGAGGGLGAQEFFGRKLAWPWWAVWKDLSSLGSFVTLGSMLALASIGFAAWITVRDIRLHRWGYTWFMVAVMGMHLLLARQRLPYTIGATRYMMTTIPFLAAIAWRTRRLSRPMLRALTVAWVMICMIGALTIGRGQFEVG